MSFATNMCAVVVEQEGDSRVWVALGSSGTYAGLLVFTKLLYTDVCLVM